jgi:hypothetical protein
MPRLEAMTSPRIAAVNAYKHPAQASRDEYLLADFALTRTQEAKGLDDFPVHIVDAIQSAEQEKKKYRDCDQCDLRRHVDAEQDDEERRQRHLRKAVKAA